MSDLLPCPFCGGDAYTEIYIVEAAAGCRECQFKVTREHRPYEYDGLPNVIAAWNRRALPAVQPAAREAALQEAANGLRKAAEELDGYVGRGYGDEYLELANSLALIDRSAHD